MSNIVDQATKNKADRRALGGAVGTIENRAELLTIEQAQRLAKVLRDRFEILIAGIVGDNDVGIAQGNAKE